MSVWINIENEEKPKEGQVVQTVYFYGGKDYVSSHTYTTEYGLTSNTHHWKPLSEYPETPDPEIARINADRRALAEALGAMYRTFEGGLVFGEGQPIEDKEDNHWKKVVANARSALEAFDRDESVKQSRKITVKARIDDCFETLGKIKSLVETIHCELWTDWDDTDSFHRLEDAYDAIEKKDDDDNT